MEESMKHMCRLCNKGFPCGRSLGGHMRSHVINSTHHHHDHHDQVEKKSCSSVGDKVCKQCGKGFQSWKALFGHMKCHSTKLSNKKTKKIESLDDQDCWTSHSDDENSNSKNRRIKRSRLRSGNRNKRYVVTTTSCSNSMNVNCNQISSNNGSTSMVSEIEQEQEAEVAMSLMMLSRDMGRCGKKMNKFGETEVGFDFLGRSEVGLSKNNEFDSDLGKFKDSNKRKLEFCGHKASHQKPLKREIDSTIQNEIGIEHKPMLDHDQTINGYVSRTSIDHQESSSFNLDHVYCLKKKKVVLGAHECPICLKVFTSGQALGGHKRSHLVSEARLNQENNTNVIKKPDELVRRTQNKFLDLNMLPEEEEMNMSYSSTTEYKSYYWEDSSDQYGSRVQCLLSTS